MIALAAVSWFTNRGGKRKKNMLRGVTAGGVDQGTAQWTLWQICDSGLPTGGFAHSAGLEAAAAQGIVRAKHSASLIRFVRGTLANASTLQLPLLKAAFEIHSLDAWLEVDSVAHACITGEAARRASLAQGAGLLRAAQAMFPLGEQFGKMIGEFRALVRGGAITTGSRERAARGHQAPAFGVVCRALGVGEREATRAFMYLVARDVLSAATRLSLIGPLEAGRIVNSLHAYVEALVAKGEAGATSGGVLEDHALSGFADGVGARVSQVDPVQDIVQGLHDQLYSRMFNS